MTADLLDRVDEENPAAVVGEDEAAGGTDPLSDYLARLRGTRLLTLAEEQELFRRKERGDATATRRLIEANLRLVVWVARRYGRPGIPLLDLIQEGNLGLMRAVERFDHRIGSKLSTYAIWWIRQAIEEAAADYSQSLPLPIRVWRQIHQLRRARQRLCQRLNREPTIAELAEATELEVRRVERLQEYEQLLVSLETPLPDGESELGDVVEDTSSPPPEHAAVERMRSAELGVVLGELDARLRLVLDRRFGLSDESPRSLQEIGEELGVTRERARQLEVRALEKLRKSAPELRVYLEAM